MLIAGTSLSCKSAAPSYHIRPSQTYTKPAAAISNSAPVHSLPQKSSPLIFPSLYTGIVCSILFTSGGKQIVFNYGEDGAVSAVNLVTGRLSWQAHVTGYNARPMLQIPGGREIVIPTVDPDSVTPIAVCTIHGKLVKILPGYDPDGEGITRLTPTGRYLVTMGYRRPARNAAMVRHVTEVWSTRTWLLTDRRRSKPISLDAMYSQDFDHPAIPAISPVGKILPHTPILPITPLSIKGGYPAGNWWRKTAEPMQDKFTGRFGRLFAQVRGDHNSRGEVIVWDLIQHKKIWTAKLTDGGPLTGAISPNGHELAVAGIGKSITFFDLKTGRLLAKTPCATDALRCLVYSPNGRVLAAGGGIYKTGDGIILLNAATHKRIASLRVAFDNKYDDRMWIRTHPRWYTQLAEGSFTASAGILPKIAMLDKSRLAEYLKRYNQPERVKAALKLCWGK